MRILVCHPERQHAHRLAISLASSNNLKAFISGAPIPEQLAFQQDLFRRIYGSIWLRRAAARMRPVSLSKALSHLSFRLFDFMASMHMDRSVDGVIGYEAACLSIFRKAKANGVFCILDAASFDAQTQKRWVDESNPDWLIDHKKDEIRLADAIFTCSELAAQTYRNAWPNKPVYTLPLAVDKSHFGPPANIPSGDVLQLLFVGHLTRVKGADTLAAAMRILHDQNVNVSLRIVTQTATADPDILKEIMNFARLISPMPPQSLANEMGQNDVLVLPSRIESFGLVVAESMACNTPVIVSENVGAKELVTPGKNGWIVPVGDAFALARTITQLVNNITLVRKSRQETGQNLATRSWETYGSEANRLITGLVERNGKIAL